MTRFMITFHPRRATPLSGRSIIGAGSRPSPQTRLRVRPVSPARVAIPLLFAVLSLHADPLSRTFTEGDVSVTLTLDPGRVDLATDTELTLTLSAPPDSRASLPADLSDRLDGFDIAGSYASDSASGGDSEQTWHYRLIPIAGAPDYRIRPIPITVENTSRHPPETSWFPTAIIRIDGPTPPDNETGTVATDLEPKYIPPSFRAVPKIIGFVLAGAVLLALAGWALSRLHLQRKIRRMSPRERAIRELDILLRRGLPEKGLFKDFYIELTMVVRRYIERRHGIRAPELTTEEFLAAATGNPHFDTASIHELNSFLTAADLIKFAGAAATVSSAAEAAKKAREFLDHETAGDAPESRREEEA